MLILARHFDPGKRQSLIGAGKDIHIPTLATMKNAVAGFFDDTAARAEQEIAGLLDRDLILIFLPGEACVRNLIVRRAEHPSIRRTRIGF